MRRTKYEVIDVPITIFRGNKVWVPSGKYRGRKFDKHRWLIWINDETCTLVSDGEL